MRLVPQLLAVVRAIDAVNRTVWNGVRWATLAMVLIGAYNALARYLDGHFEARLSSNSWVELSWYLFSIVFLLAAPWALRQGAHVRVDVLYGRLGQRGKAWIDLVGGLGLLLPFCLFALFSAWPAVVNSIQTWEASPDPDGLSRWPIKLVVPVAFALLSAQGVAEVLRRILFLFGGLSAEQLELDPKLRTAASRTEELPA
ncbi:MAG: TRAP transporter small permease subunit [Planctomycetota bacterium]|nr:TRAP transporter small permease subunit [Planctomycetota bacterium]